MQDARARNVGGMTGTAGGRVEGTDGAQNRPRRRANDGKNDGIEELLARKPLILLANSAENGGGGWIRTNVGLANGFTVRPL